MQFYKSCSHLDNLMRAEYDPKSDLLDQEFMLRGKWYQRKDVEIKNSRGDVLKCSHYVPIISPEGKPLPCVIYCHGNSGCRADASEAAIILLPSNITVFALDFSGSGLSGGEHVTLGWNEKDDLKAVVNYLREDGNVSLIGLWGRSMGAVTSLMYGAEDPSIAGMVLDSPFSDLVDLMMELVDTYKVRLPKFTVKFAIQYMRRAIQKKAKFDITDLNTIKVAKSCFVPALLGHAIDDDFIHPHHSDRIFEAYMGDKNIIKFEGDHNSPRPQFYFDSINIFFHNVLQPPEDEVGESFYDNVNDYFGKDVWRSVHEVAYSNESSSMNKEPSSSSTIDAIRQVRSRRPMSRMEVPSDISSKDEHCDHEEEKGGDLSPSSSSMISFELSNGNSYGPQVPAALDDDQFVEYPLEDLAGFPSSAEEEERMFMEAVIQSLKDMEVKKPETEQAPAAGNVGTASSEPSDKDDSHLSSQEVSRSKETEPSLDKPSTDSKSKMVFTSSEDCIPMKAESNPSSANHSQSLASVGSGISLEVAPTPSQPAPDIPSVSESSNANASGSSQSDSSTSVQSSSDTDVSHNTKATVTVVKNPAAGHVMDGLMRRWDLFRNSNNR
ncbi:uncharacterized protein LOC107637813 isoform X1 [Arachis ipaensis]|uniref:uncharacterized protein LOC107637813 isoform X1 n=2 Tax=Arachis ipaensis TaxID=130454 RepID=UPI000A2B6BA1|nr:uncharacterized protein LOC107637813 isoform X1 [Arachis ipaensis]XP_020960173.1 uncharacterized protein LOC107637813 isoform X1 [Arachis ipaensis]